MTKLRTREEHDNQCWSVDEENFSYNSLDDLIDDNGDIEIGRTVWVADKVPITPLELCSGYDVIDKICDRASEIGGDYADNFIEELSGSKSKEQCLDKIIEKWITDNCEIGFWRAENIKEYEIIAQDIGVEP